MQNLETGNSSLLEYQCRTNLFGDPYLSHNSSFLLQCLSLNGNVFTCFDIVSILISKQTVSFDILYDIDLSQKKVFCIISALSIGLF